MSDDGFDREAERERLREKYERDEADREATKRMSELLLKGATMTNRHCGDCGDPIFKNDGDLFCPTCGDGVGHGGESSDDDGGATSPSVAKDGTTSRNTGTTEDGDAVEADIDRTDSQPAEQERSTPGEADSSAADHRSAARESLARSAARFARRAEESDDPAEARRLLAAAREAAAGLAALGPE
jgi:uncharacterized Zn finger protein (UPF0148 family)